MTYADFVTYVKRTLKRTDKDDEIVDSMIDGLRDIAKRFRFMELQAQSYIDLTETREDWALPSDCLFVYHPIRLLEGGATNDTGWALTHISKDEYDEMEPNPNRTSPDTGQPSHYTIWNNCILLAPIPAVADTYQLEVNWCKDVNTSAATATSTSTVPLVLDRNRDVLKFVTLAHVYDSLEWHEEANVWRARYEEALQYMIDADASKGPSLRFVQPRSL